MGDESSTNLNPNEGGVVRGHTVHLRVQAR